MFNIGIINSFVSLPPNGLLNNLISYYKMDTNGSFPDSEGSNDGTINGATFTASALINGGYDFDGVNDTISLNTDIVDIGLSGASQISITQWINRSALGSVENLFYIRSNTGNTVFETQLQTNNKLRVAARSQTSDGFQNKTGVTVFNSTSDWVHIVIVIDFANDKIISYIDGVKDIDDTVSFGSNTLNYTSNAVQIGGNTFSGSPPSYEGEMDELGVYARALTQGDVTELFNAGDGLSYNNFTT